MLNVIIKFDDKLHFGKVDPELPIKQIFNLIQYKYNIKIENSHNIYIASKLLDDNEPIKKYNLENNSIINIRFSMCKMYRNNPNDLLGDQAFSRLIDYLNSKSKINVYNLVSLMSYNVTDHNINKNLLQQTQYNSIKHIISHGLKNNQRMIRINIMLPDYNFIKHNKLYIENYKANLDCEYLTEGLSMQINDYFKFQPDIKFITNSECFNDRILKFTINSQTNGYLFDLLNINHQEIRIKICFYYVGINFKPDAVYNIHQGIIHGFNYKSLFGKNLVVNMWTGDEIYSDIK